MGLGQSIMQGLSGTKKPLSPADASHKKLFIELAALAILVLCLPFIIWWIWGCINNFGRWKVTDNSKSDRKHYIKTWHGFTEREKVDRRKQKRKEVRDKFRSMFVWKTTRGDYSWIFWDPDGSKKAEFEEERNSTWLRHLPRWMRSKGYGSLESMTAGNSNRLGDAEKGLIQSRPFRNSDEVRPSHPFDANQLHRTARVSSWQVDGIEQGTCITRTGLAMDGVLNGSSTTVSTILRRRLPQGTSRVFAAESAETHRAVQSQLFTSEKAAEYAGTSVSFHETPISPKRVASLGNVTIGECITLEKHATEHELLSSVDGAALPETFTLPGTIEPDIITICESEDQQSSGNIPPGECITPEERISSLGNLTPSCITPEKHATEHELLSSVDGAALPETSTLPRSIKPDIITICESEDQQSSRNIYAGECITPEEHITSSGNVTSRKCTTLEEHIASSENLIPRIYIPAEEYGANHKLLSSGDDVVLREIFALPESIKPLDNITICANDYQQSSGNVTLGRCITLEEHSADYGAISSDDDTALQSTSTRPESIMPSANLTLCGSDNQHLSGDAHPRECITQEEHIADHHESLSSDDDTTLQSTSTRPESIMPSANLTLCESDYQHLSGNAHPRGCITPKEHIADHHQPLSSSDNAALQRTSTIPESITAPDSISLCESDDQKSSTLQSTPTTIHNLAPRFPALMNGVIRLNQSTEISPEAADRLEEQLKSALAEKRNPFNAAQRTEGTCESSGSEDTISFTDLSFTNLPAWKKRERVSLDTSSSSSRSSLPSQFLCRPRARPRPTAHVGRILEDLRTKPRRASRGHRLAARAAYHWSTLENPELEEQDLPLNETPIIHSQHTTDSEAGPRSIADMIRKFRETSVSYRREVSHSHISTMNEASEVDAVEHPSPLKSAPSRTYGSIKISKLRNTIRGASISHRREVAQRHISTIDETSEVDETEHPSPLKPLPPRSTYGSIKISKLRNTIRATAISHRREASSSHSRISTIHEANEPDAIEQPAASRRPFGSLKMSKLRNTIRVASTTLLKTTRWSGRTSASRKDSTEVVISEADSAEEWESDFDPEAYEREREIRREEERAAEARARGRASLSTRFRLMKERVLRRRSE